MGSVTNRRLPNILVTGTPGTGKTTTCELVAEATGFNYINVGDWVSSQSLHSGWDAKFQAHIIDEDKVCQPSKTPLAVVSCTTQSFQKQYLHKSDAIHFLFRYVTQWKTPCLKVAMWWTITVATSSLRGAFAYQYCLPRLRCH